MQSRWNIILKKKLTTIRGLPLSIITMAIPRTDMPPIDGDLEILLDLDTIPGGVGTADLDFLLDGETSGAGEADGMTRFSRRSMDFMIPSLILSSVLQDLDFSPGEMHFWQDITMDSMAVVLPESQLWESRSGPADALLVPGMLGEVPFLE